MNEMKPYILPALNNELPYIFIETHGFDLKNISLSSDDIKFDLSLVLNEKYTSFTPIHALFITLMVFYVIATVVASIIAHQRYKARKQKALKKRKRMMNR